MMASAHPFRIGPNLKDATRNFFGTYRRVFKGLTKREYQLILAGIGLGLLASALQLALLGSLYLATNFIEGMAFPGSDPVQESAYSTSIIVLAFSMAIGTAFLLIACLTYASERIARKLGRQLHERSVNRLIEIHREALPTTPAIDGQNRSQELSRAINRDARIVGLAAEQSLQIVQIILFCLTFFLMLFVLDVYATLLVASLGLVAIPFLALAIKHTKVAARTFNSGGAQALSKAASDLTRRTESIYLPGSPPPEMGKKDFTDNLRETNNQYDNYLLAGRRSTFITSVFKAVSASAILLLLGWQSTGGQLSLSAAIVYLLALLRAAGYGTSLASYVMNFARFYPMIHNYFSVLDWLQAEAGEDRTIEDREKIEPLRGTVLVEMAKPASKLDIIGILKSIPGLRAPIVDSDGNIVFVARTANKFTPRGRETTIAVQREDPEPTVPPEGDLDRDALLRHLVDVAIARSPKVVIFSCIHLGSASEPAQKSILATIRDQVPLAIFTTDGRNMECRQFDFVAELGPNGPMPAVRGCDTSKATLGAVVMSSEEDQEADITTLIG